MKRYVYISSSNHVVTIFVNILGDYCWIIETVFVNLYGVQFISWNDNLLNCILTTISFHLSCYSYVQSICVRWSNQLKIIISRSSSWKAFTVKKTRLLQVSLKPKMLLNITVLLQMETLRLHYCQKKRRKEYH